MDNNSEEVANTEEIRAAQVIADKLNFLFEACTKPNGERYTPREVEEGTGGKVTQSWIWKLSKGRSTRPGLVVLKALSDFFEVEPSFWFNELDDKTKARIKIEKGGEQVQNIALRASELSPEAQQMILSIIESFDQNGIKTTKKHKDD